MVQFLSRPVAGLIIYILPPDGVSTKFNRCAMSKSLLCWCCEPCFSSLSTCLATLLRFACVSLLKGFVKGFTNRPHIHTSISVDWDGSLTIVRHSCGCHTVSRSIYLTVCLSHGCVSRSYRCVSRSHGCVSRSHGLSIARVCLMVVRMCLTVARSIYHTGVSHGRTDVSHGRTVYLSHDLSISRCLVVYLQHDLSLSRSVTVVSHWCPTASSSCIYDDAVRAPYRWHHHHRRYRWFANGGSV